MAKKHLKGIAVPKTWHIPRKETVFVTRPYPGAHSMLYSMPLNILLKELIKCAQTTKEVRYILEKKQVLVDGLRRQEYKMPVGLFDVISLPDGNSNYRVVINRLGKLAVVSIPKEETGIKPCKVIGKTILGKGKWQLHLSGSRNILLTKPEYNVGDTIMISLPKQEVKQHLKLEHGALVYLTGGKHIGETGLVERIDGNTIFIKSNQSTYETPKQYVFVIGKEKPAVTIA